MVHTSKTCAKCFPKGLRIVGTAVQTLQEGLSLNGYNALSKEADLAIAARCGGRGPEVMKSVAVGPENILQPTTGDIEVSYYSTSRVQVVFGLGHPSH